MELGVKLYYAPSRTRAEITRFEQKDAFGWIFPVQKFVRHQGTRHLGDSIIARLGW